MAVTRLRIARGGWRPAFALVVAIVTAVAVTPRSDAAFSDSTANGSSSLRAGTFVDPPVHEATVTAESLASAAVTVPGVAGVTGDVYLAAVSTNRKSIGATSVSGLGLGWQPIGEQCTAANRTGVSLWWAQGAAATGSVTATLSAAPDTAIMAVSRFSGVHSTAPIGATVAANARGVGGACVGGALNQTSYSAPSSTTTRRSLVVGVVALRKGRKHTPGAGYTEIYEFRGGSGKLRAGMAAQTMAVIPPGTVSVNGTFNKANDWALVAVEIVT